MSNYFGAPKGKAGVSQNEKGQRVYWLAKESL